MNLQSFLDENTSLTSQNVKITQVLGYELPEPIRSTSVEFNKKKNRFEATFPFTEMVKFLTPGVSEVTVQVGDDVVEQYTTSVETKWKMD